MKTPLRAFVKATPSPWPSSAKRGGLVLHEIDPEQAWFWRPEWLGKEREADEDLAAGRLTRYESDEEFLAALDAEMKPPDADA